MVQENSPKNSPVQILPYVCCKCTLPSGMLSEWALSNNGTSYMVNLTFIWSFSLINWVDNVNWPPSIVSKLTLRALALRQSDWRNCGLCVCVFAVCTPFKRRSREFMVLEKCGVIFTGQTRLSKGNFPFNLDSTLSIVQFPFWNKHETRRLIKHACMLFKIPRLSLTEITITFLNLTSNLERTIENLL